MSEVTNNPTLSVNRTTTAESIDNKWYEGLASNRRPPTPAALITALKQFSQNPDSLKKVPNQSLLTQRKSILTGKDKTKKQRIIKNISKMLPMAGSFTEQAESVSSIEMIRISGDLIERMNNLSG